MASFNPKFSNIIKIFTELLSNVGGNVRANCALIADAIIPCTQWCLLKNESLKCNSFMYMFPLLARVTNATLTVYF